MYSNENFVQLLECLASFQKKESIFTILNELKNTEFHDFFDFDNVSEVLKTDLINKEQKRLLLQSTLKHNKDYNKKLEFLFYIEKKEFEFDENDFFSFEVGLENSIEKIKNLSIFMNKKFLTNQKQIRKIWMKKIQMK